MFGFDRILGYLNDSYARCHCI